MTGHRRIAASLAVAATLLTLVSACSISDRPAWWPGAKHSDSHSQSVTAKQVAVPTVAHPWHKGMRQLGIQVYWLANSNDSSDAVVRAKSRRLINYAISLNANSITVTFPFFTHGITSDKVFAEASQTPSPQHIQIFLEEAAKSHMRVTLRPLLNEDILVAENSQAWRGSIEPADPSAWFHNYEKMLMPFVRVAQAGHAATFVIGTELESLEPSPHWRDLISAIKRVYKGQLTYDENYDEFTTDPSDPNLPLRTYDIDAYPRFNLPDSASVSSLAQAWEGWLALHPASVLHHLVLSEVGIDAVADSYDDPGAWIGTVHSPIDTTVQAHWYQAVCDAVSAKHLAGVYWWEINFDASTSDPKPFLSDRLTFLDRPAQNVIRSCFAKLSATKQASTATAK